MSEQQFNKQQLIKHLTEEGKRILHEHNLKELEEFKTKSFELAEEKKRKFPEAYS